MFTIEVNFSDSATHEAVTSWIDTIVVPSLPDGATANLKSEEVAIAAELLTADHIGKHVRFTTGPGLEVFGILDAIIPTVYDYAVVLVIEGKAHYLTFGLVRVSF